MHHMQVSIWLGLSMCKAMCWCKVRPSNRLGFGHNFAAATRACMLYDKRIGNIHLFESHTPNQSRTSKTTSGTSSSLQAVSETVMV